MLETLSFTQIFAIHSYHYHVHNAFMFSPTFATNSSQYGVHATGTQQIAPQIFDDTHTSHTHQFVSFFVIFLH